MNRGATGSCQGSCHVGPAKRRPSPASGGGLVLLLASLGLVLGFAGAGSKPVGDDVVWKRPGLDQARLRVIAVMPVVSVNGDEGANRVVEDALARQFFGHSWVQAKESRDRLRATASRHDSLFRAVSRQVFRKTRLDPTTARHVARLLGAEALLTVRIDRWERLSVSDEYDRRAFVNLNAALVDSSGNLLWKISQREVVETPRKLLAKLDSGPGAWRLRERYGLGAVPEDFKDAVSLLVARWLTLVPWPPS